MEYNRGCRVYGIWFLVGYTWRSRVVLWYMVLLYRSESPKEPGLRGVVLPNKAHLGP